MQFDDPHPLVHSVGHGDRNEQAEKGIASE
jgi:hypothetical protein